MESLSIFFLQTVFLTILITIRAASTENLIDSTCRASVRYDPNINFDFCTTSLQASPATQCATLRGLGSISIRLIRDNITDTRRHIKHLLKNNTKSDPYFKVNLDDCLELYSDAIPSVQQAMGLYKDRRFDEANVRISSVMDDSTTCEDGFKEREGFVSPLTKRNNDTFQLSAMALSVMRIIQTISG